MQTTLFRVQPIMHGHGLKAQQHIAQGKRSDTLGRSTFISDALKGQKRIAQGKRSDTLGRSTFVSDALKGQQRIAQGKRSDTLGKSAFISDALKGQKLYFSSIKRFCPYRASML